VAGGWWAQHQRLLKGLRDQPGRAAVFLSGDLHASVRRGSFAAAIST
jgi:carbohydrate-selective porin OprB